jgi:Ni/Co efflux regulator RcnB
VNLANAMTMVRPLSVHPRKQNGMPDRDAMPAPGRAPQANWERGAGPQHAYHRGGRLPQHYHQQQYVVDDWRGHNLSAPPHGYHWVQTGDDYVLVAIATGIIMQLMLNH